MSQQIPSPRGGASGGHRNGTDVRHDLWVPTLVRALVALVFGAVTIFWQEPTENAAPWALGLFLVGTGGAWLFLHFRMKGREDVDLGSRLFVSRVSAVSETDCHCSSRYRRDSGLPAFWRSRRSCGEGSGIGLLTRHDGW